MNSGMHAFFAARRAGLGESLKQEGVTLYLQPMTDAFQNEYLPASTERLPWLTGFTGSAGMGLFWAAEGVAPPRATLLVDGRYILQAPQEVGNAVEVLLSESPLGEWLAQHCPQAVIGFDPWLVTHAQLTQWQTQTARAGIVWQPIPNPVDQLWADRPAEPTAPVMLHPLAYAGRPYAEKRAALLELLADQSADALALTLPDGVNWLLNLRGGDIPFNPLMLAYAVLHRQGRLDLYVYERMFSEDVEKYFAHASVFIHNINAILHVKSDANALLFPPAARILLDPQNAAHGWWQRAAREGWEILPTEDPTLLPKACKNATEQAGMRLAHRRDGRAVSRFLGWLEGRVAANQCPDELEIVATLESFRQQEPDYRQPSFATIAGAGEHGAIVHYRADAASNRRLALGELLLLDSGGQYPLGTTDITRTVAIGTPSEAMREHFTRVLKGHISLACAVFPHGTNGAQLDVLARQFLWQAGLDFNHGTGHGVGAYLCVHEGPQRISKRPSSAALKVGMVLSNEPGYYAQGAYGIRIESLLMVQPAEAEGFLQFETLTLAPIDQRLIVMEMLTVQEVAWLNAYHARIWEAYEGELNAAERDWLRAATAEIPLP